MMKKTTPLLAALGLSVATLPAAAAGLQSFVFGSQGSQPTSLVFDSLNQTEFLENEFNLGGINGAGTDIQLPVIGPDGIPTGEMKFVEPLQVGDALEGYVLFPSVTLNGGIEQSTASDFQLTGEYLLEVTGVADGIAQLDGFFNIFEDRTDGTSNPGGFTEAAFPNEDNFLDGQLLGSWDVTGSFNAQSISVDGVVPSSVRGIVAESVTLGAVLSLVGSFNSEEDSLLSEAGAITVSYNQLGPLDSKEDFGIFAHGGEGAVAFSTTVVPVPAAVWLFGSALLGLVGFKRKKTV